MIPLSDHYKFINGASFQIIKMVRKEYRTFSFSLTRDSLAEIMLLSEAGIKAKGCVVVYVHRGEG